MNPLRPGDKRAGFTLVEVIVALAVVALALPVLLTTFYHQADNTAYLRDRTTAQMVAANKLTEVRLAAQATSKLEASKESGSSRFADRDWYWNVEISVAPGVPNFYRIEVAVSNEEDDGAEELYKLAGFMSGDFREDSSSFSGSNDDDNNDDPQDNDSDRDNTDPGNSDLPTNLQELRDRADEFPEAAERFNRGG